jgi:hypothetical protein
MRGRGGEGARGSRSRARKQRAQRVDQKSALESVLGSVGSGSGPREERGGSICRRAGQRLESRRKEMVAGAGGFWVFRRRG